MACTLSTRHVSKNIEHILQDNQTKTRNGALETTNNNENRPLLVILSWLLAKRMHIMKFANLYLEQGFDVAIVSITPWQLMWPTKGSRVSTRNIQLCYISLIFILHNLTSKYVY